MTSASALPVSRSARALLLALAVGAVACRPDVEGRLPCTQDGDLSCPTGWRCGEAGFCVAGEPPPAVRFLAPSGSPASAGAFLDVEFVASSPRGLASASLFLESGRGRFELPLTASLADGERRATYTARVETWRAGSGPAALIVRVTTKGAPVETTELRHDLEVSLPALALAFEAPANGAAVRGRVPVRAHTSSEVPFEDCEFTLGTARENATVTPVAGGTDLTATIDVSSFTDASYDLRIQCRDALDRNADAVRGIDVENTALTLTLAAPEVVIAKETRTLRAVVSKPIPEPPTLTFADGTHLVAGDVVVVDARTFDFPLTGIPEHAGPETAQVVARDRFGDEEAKTAGFQIDTVGPTGQATEIRDYSVFQLGLTCDEDATFRADLGGHLADVIGTCGATPIVRTLGTSLWQLWLIDAHGNEKELVPQTVVEELVPAIGEARIPVSTRFDPVRAIARPEVVEAVHRPNLQFPEGMGEARPNVSAPSQTGLMHPLGQLHESVPVSAAHERNGRVHFLAPDGPYHHWWEIDQNGTTRLLWPFAELGDGVLAPMFDPRDGTVLASKDGQLVSIGLHGRVTPLRPLPIGEGIRLRGRVCGNRLFAVGTAPSLQILVADLDETTPAGPESFGIDGTPVSAHVLCDGDGTEGSIVVAVAEDEFVRFLTRQNGAWAVDPTVRMRAHLEPIVGSSFYGGGRWTIGNDTRPEFHELEHGAFRLISFSPGLARRNGTALRRADGSILVIGGTDGAWDRPRSLLLTEATGFVDSLQAPWGETRGTFDVANDKLLALGPDQTDQPTKLWEWTPANGWRLAATLPQTRHGASIVWDPSTSRAYILGGYSGNDFFETEFVYDGATGSLTERSSPIRSVSLKGTPLSNGRLALWPGWEGSPWTTATYDVRTQVLVTATNSGRGGALALQRTSDDLAISFSGSWTGGDGSSRWDAWYSTPDATTQVPEFTSTATFHARGPFILNGWDIGTYVTNGAIRRWDVGAVPVPVPLPSLAGNASPGGSPNQMVATEIPGAWAQRLWIPYLAPSYWEWSDYAAGAYWIDLPAGEVRVELCATDSATGAGNSRAQAWIASGSELERLTPSGGSTCSLYAFERTSDEPAALVVASNGEPSRTLILDQLRIRRVTRR